MRKNEKMMEKMYARFRAVDTDGSGFLEYDELRRILKPMGYNADGIRGLLEQFDLDKDDALSFDEFNELSEFLIVGTAKIEEKARRDAEKHAERERIRAEKAEKLSMEEMAAAAKEANLCVAFSRPRRSTLPLAACVFLSIRTDPADDPAFPRTAHPQVHGGDDAQAAHRHGGAAHLHVVCCERKGPPDDHEQYAAQGEESAAHVQEDGAGAGASRRAQSGGREGSG